MDKIKPTTPVLKGFKEKVPSNWNVVQGDTPDTVTATAHTTKEVFKGPVKDFNLRLRG